MARNNLFKAWFPLVPKKVPVAHFFSPHCIIDAFAFVYLWVHDDFMSLHPRFIE